MIKRKKCFLILLTTFMCITKCYAVGLSFGTIGEGGTPTEVPYEDWSEIKNGDEKYGYRYKQQITTNTAIRMDGYNIKGTSVMPTTTIINTPFSAGTWIGINITENQSASWKVSDFEYKKIVKDYTCEYKYDGGSPYTCNSGTTSVANQSACDAYESEYDNVNFKPHYPGSSHGDCTYSDTCYTSDKTHTEIIQDVDYYKQFTCDSTYTDTSGYTYTLTDTSYEERDIAVSSPETDVIEQIETDAINKAELSAKSLVGASLGNVRYITNNRYPQNVENITTDIITSTKKYNDIQVIGSGTKNGTAWQEYEYLQDKVCMNLKNSNVTYGRDCDTTNGEIQIENNIIYDSHLGENVKYWHYFIPLNTKKNSIFYLQVTSNTARKLNVKECLNAMEKYKDNYVDYIVPDAINSNVDNTLFTMNEVIDKRTIEENDGCYFSTTIYIPIEQKFYNELNNGTFKGFNFYYKPIPTNLSSSGNIADKVFPNGVASSSLWKEWYDKTKENKNPLPNLNNNDISYIANIYGNVGKIREYNSTVPYTTWEFMKTNGESLYVENEGIIATELEEGDFYKLGCGPANEKQTNSDGSTNYLYQERCKKS